jgi:two-component system chemotaxis response regulator CheY
VVDDDPVVRASCRKILQEEGHQVQLCTSAPEALSELSRQDWQLLLVDIIMPEFDGLYLIGKARRDFPSLPILVMSGYPTPETIASGQQVGASHFIAKPFTPEELSAAVARALAGREKE